MNDRRFRYSLRPLLLVKQWERDAAALSLADANAKVVEAGRTVRGIEASLDAAQASRRAILSGRAAISVEILTMAARHAAELAHARAAQAERVVSLETARDELALEAVQAERKVGALDRHRAQAYAAFRREAARTDYRAADDQWCGRAVGEADHAD
jgi:hypothetical protein